MKNRAITFTAILFTLGFLALAPTMQAVVPPPDGGYPGFNTAEGQNALFSLTSGSANTAVGWLSLRSLTEGRFNTAIGAGALLSNIGEVNTATGAGALLFNTTGGNNTANGVLALFNNTIGFDNTACGSGALLSNVIGNANTATGFHALFTNGTGNNNTAIGVQALLSNTTGSNNTANGTGALQSNTEGIGNTALGAAAGQSITGSGNVCIGVGVLGEGGVDDSTYIRNVNTLTQNFSAGVNDYVTVRLSDGRLGHTQVVSSQRYKEDIKPLATSSQALYALNPVSFRLKKEFDPARALGFGLIAEEVEKVDPALVYRNGKGQVESVRYDMVNAMLLNEFLKEHHTVQELKNEVAALTATVKEQAAQIQKVSAQLEASKPAPQVVTNP